MRKAKRFSGLRGTLPRRRRGWSSQRTFLLDCEQKKQNRRFVAAELADEATPEKDFPFELLRKARGQQQIEAVKPTVE